MQNKSIRNTLNLTANSDKLFFGDSGHGIARYDVVRYPTLLKINHKMQGYFWRPVEIDMSAEKRSFEALNKAEQHVFTSNLRRQILLDSVQGRAPSLAFLPHCTDSALENCILTWSFFESIHSESYTHIIRAIYSDPEEVTDGIPYIKEIADCANSVTAAYDAVRDNPSKENLYLALISANALEALRFYVSFACTFSFAERGFVEGSAKVIRFIARDEAEHLALVSYIIKLLSNDDPDYIQIIQDNRKKAIDIFNEAAEQEKAWAKYLFKEGPILGLTEGMLAQYIDYLLPKRLAAVKLIERAKNNLTDPLPWMKKYLSNSSVQGATQEIEVASYVTASINNDIKKTDLKKLWNSQINI